MTKVSEIKLLGVPESPYVTRVRFALNLKCIEYEFIYENPALRSERLLTANPLYAKVPVLIHGNKTPIPESCIIIEYLDEIEPDVHRLLPTDPLLRAENQVWAKYIDTKFFPLYQELRLTSNKEGKEAIKKQMIEKSQLLEDAFVKFSNGKPYFGGDDVGYLDVVLGSNLAWTKFVEQHDDMKVFDEVRTPKLVEWVKRIWSNEAFKIVAPSNETLISFYSMLQIVWPPRAACSCG